MGRKATPQYGIKYTFKFRNEEGTHYTTLLFEGRNDKGRLEFWNYESKNLTTMRDERFSYIHRFNLVREEPIERVIKEVPKHLIVEPEQIELEIEKNIFSSYAEKISSLTLQQKEILERELGISIEDFKKELNQADGVNNEEFDKLVQNGFMRRVFSLQTALLKANGHY